MRHLFWGTWAPFWVKYRSIVHGVCIGKLYKGITFTPQCSGAKFGGDCDENAHGMGDDGTLMRSGDSDSEDEADEEMEESDGDELELTYESEDDE